MEPQNGIEPALSTWADWELSQYPQLMPLLTTSKLLMTYTLALSYLTTALGTHCCVSALQMYAGGLRLARQGWPQADADAASPVAAAAQEWHAPEIDTALTRQAA